MSDLLRRFRKGLTLPSVLTSNPDFFYVDAAQTNLINTSGTRALIGDTLQASQTSRSGHAFTVIGTVTLEQRKWSRYPVFNFATGGGFESYGHTAWHQDDTLGMFYGGARWDNATDSSNNRVIVQLDDPAAASRNCTLLGRARNRWYTSVLGNYNSWSLNSGTFNALHTNIGLGIYHASMNSAHNCVIWFDGDEFGEHVYMNGEGWEGGSSGVQYDGWGHGAAATAGKSTVCIGHGNDSNRTAIDRLWEGDIGCAGVFYGISKTEARELAAWVQRHWPQYTVPILGDSLVNSNNCPGSMHEESYQQNYGLCFDNQRGTNGAGAASVATQWASFEAAGYKVRGLMINAARNDLNNGDSAATVYAAMKTTWDAILASPLVDYLFLWNETPVKGTTGFTAGEVTEHTTYKGLVEQYCADNARAILLDTYPVLAVGNAEEDADPSPTYYSPVTDLHPTQAGHDKLAQDVILPTIIPYYGITP